MLMVAVKQRKTTIQIISSFQFLTTSVINDDVDMTL